MPLLFSEPEMYNNNISINNSTGSSSSGYPYHQQVNESSSSNYLGFFYAYSPLDSYLHPPPNYVYPPLPLPPDTPINSYRSDFHDVGTTSYYGYHALPRTEINRRTWEYSSSMHIQEPTMDMQSQSAWEDNIDPDNMTYEEVLDLGEAVGTHNRGLSQELIKLLPTSRCKAGSFFSRKKSRERCVICLVTYKIGEQQMRLPCKHVYHSKCGRKWLSINKTCPVCNSQVYGDDART